MRIKHHGKGYSALLKDPAVVADLHNRAQRIAAAAGGEDEAIYAPTPSTPRKRARAAVVAANGDPDNKILRSMDAGR